MLEKDQFLNIVKNAPLVAIDLIVRNADGALLMGMRVNQPAAGFWFVPGGRIRKNETLEEAFSRIARMELGKSYTLDNAKLFGAFTHKYSTNFAEAADIGTHYVVLAYELRTEIDIGHLPRDQHSQYKWIQPNDDAADIHENSKAYFYIGEVP